MAPVGLEFGAAEMGRKRGSTLATRFAANYGPEVPGLIPLNESLRYFIKRGALEAWGATSAYFVGRDQDVRDVPLLGKGSESYRTCQRLMHESRGYYPLPGSHGKKPALGWLGEPVRIDAEWDHGMRLLAEACQSLGIPLLLRFSPMPSDQRQVRDFSPIERWSQDLKRSYPQLTVGRPTLLWYDWDLCYDNIHLNASGVAVYMAFLAKDVRAVLEGVGAPDQK
jgi:hypothetical protein